VSWRDRWFNSQWTDEQLLRQRMADAADAAKHVFLEVGQQLASCSWSEVYASSGTAKMLSTICAQKFYGTASPGLVNVDMLKALENDIVNLGLNPNLSLPGLKNSRKELLLPGWAVLTGFMEAYRITNLHFSPAALREGMLHYIIKAKELNDSPLHVLRAS
jgi:exopolyphosphatase/guanosine-5'-triphosphate,3'-diphosphate pyrophosphatase